MMPTQQPVMVTGTVASNGIEVWQPRKLRFGIRTHTTLQNAVPCLVSLIDCLAYTYFEPSRDGFVRQALRCAALSPRPVPVRCSRLRPHRIRSVALRSSSEFLSDSPWLTLFTRVGIWLNLHLNRIIHPSTKRTAAPLVFGKSSPNSECHTVHLDLGSFPWLSSIYLELNRFPWPLC